MVSQTYTGWQFTLVAEIFKMLELLPDPDSITIRLEKEES